MSVRPPSPRADALARPQITTRAAAGQRWTLEELADGNRLPAALAALRTGQREVPQSGTALLRSAISATVWSVAAPFMLDDVTLLPIAAGDIGVVIADGEHRHSWTSGRTSHRADPSDVGALMAAVLVPVLHAIREAEPLRARGTHAYLHDALRGRLSLVQRHRGHDDLAEEILRATGLQRAQPARHLDITPDAGPVITLPLPRVCCVGGRRPDDDSCPTCNLHPDDSTRRRLTETWLRSLDATDFHHVTGRQPASAT